MVHVFIVNPQYNDKGFVTGLRKQLEGFPDLNSYVFSTGAAGDERELASMIESIFEGEQLRIYSCGGITSARNILSGISDISRIELAIYPTSHVHYLDAFGAREPFLDLGNLISGKVVRVDYIKTNHGVAIGSAAFGLDSYSYRCHDSLAGLGVFGKVLPWYLSTLYSLAVTPNHIYRITYGEEEVTMKAMQVIFCNVPITAGVVVYTDDWKINDGEASLVMVYRMNLITRLAYLNGMIRRKIVFSPEDPRNRVMSLSKVSIRHINGIPLWCSLDGELVQAAEWNLEIVKQGLKLVVPEEVSRERT